jgi:hypothetical protein
LSKNTNGSAESVIPFARASGSIRFVRGTNDPVEIVLDKTSDELSHAISTNDMAAWHSGSSVFHADLILLIGDNEARNLIEVAFGLDDFQF